MAGKDELERECRHISICLNHLSVCLSILGLVTWDVTLLPSTDVEKRDKCCQVYKFSIKVIEILGLFCDPVTGWRKPL